MPALDPLPTIPFYRTALLGLLAQEHRQPTDRRFGDEADARWNMFHGHLDVADRIDLLIRDAAVSHPAAFAPRSVFGFEDLAEDEPFGPDWQSPFGRDTGRRAWKDTLELRSVAPAELWQRALDLWSVTPDTAAASTETTGSARLVVVGASAIAGLAQRFVEHGDGLDWGRQVHALSETPAGIQLAGLVPLCAGTPTSSKVLRIDDRMLADPRTVLRDEHGWPRPDAVILAANLTATEQRLAAQLDACW